MNRLIPLIIIFSLTLGSCSTPQGATPTVVERNEPTATLTTVPTNTPNPDPSLTPTTPAVPTATIVSKPSTTPSPEVTASLPELISGQPVTITQVTMIDANKGWGIGHQTNNLLNMLICCHGNNILNCRITIPCFLK